MLDLLEELDTALKSKPFLLPVQQKSSSDSYSSSTAAMRLDGAKPLGRASVKAMHPPGKGKEVVAPGAGAGGPSGEETGAEGGGPLTSIRLSSFSKGQLAWTYHGLSGLWQMGQIPLPAIAQVHQYLIPLSHKYSANQKKDTTLDPKRQRYPWQPSGRRGLEFSCLN